MNFRMTACESKLKAGLAKPMTLFHMTDVHLFSWLPEDTPYARQQQADRVVFMRPGNPRSIEDDYADLMEMGKKCDCVVMTGDIIDAPSKGNLKILKESLEELDSYLYAVGNHDYVFPNEFLPDGKPDMLHWQELQDVVKDDMNVCVKQVGELLLIGFDNTCYQVTQEQVDTILKALDRGLPTILCCHTPLYSPDSIVHIEHIWNSPGVMGCPEEVLAKNEKWKNAYGPTPVTAKFVEDLKGYSNLVAILAGHVHFNYEEAFSEYTTQIITATASYPLPEEKNGFEVPHDPGCARVITVY